MAVQRDNPYTNHNFTVDLGAGDTIGFSEVDLPAGEIEVIEYREGNDPHARESSRPREVPERDAEARRRRRPRAFEWWQSIRDGQLLRRKWSRSPCSTSNGKPSRPSAAGRLAGEVDYGFLDALGNEVVIETLELAHEGFETE